MSRKGILLLLLPLAGAVGCETVFTRVSFHYTSLSHMSPKDSATTVSTGPEDLVFELSEAFRANGAVVVNRSKVDYVLDLTPGWEDCWRANYELQQKDFALYRQNDFQAFKHLDRSTTFTAHHVSDECAFFVNRNDPSAESWYLVIDLPPRTAETTIYRPTFDQFFQVSQKGVAMQTVSTGTAEEKKSIKLFSRLYLWASRTADSATTTVYLIARPVCDQVEASRGISIGYSWWDSTNGFFEQQVVRNYLALIQEYDRKKRLGGTGH